MTEAEEGHDEYEEDAPDEQTYSTEFYRRHKADIEARYEERERYEAESDRDDASQSHRSIDHRALSMEPRRGRVDGFSRALSNLESRYVAQSAQEMDVDEEEGTSPRRASGSPTRPQVPILPRYALGPQSLPLPTVNDPSLWLVPCASGKERVCVKKIMENYFKYRNNRNKQLFIHSAFTTDQHTGHIYVEAKKQVHVETV